MRIAQGRVRSWLVRFWLVGALSAFLTAAPVHAVADVKIEVGEAADPFQIVISLNEQVLRTYRGDQQIHTSRVSTGRRGYGTPPGVYSILDKRRRHFSNLYGGAPMPYMQRLTWSGIALHQGYVPQRPASHGCVRLPKGFARNLFGLTEIGASVIITREPQAPRRIAHANLFQQSKPMRFSDAPTLAEGPVADPQPGAYANLNIVAAQYVAMATPVHSPAPEKTSPHRDDWASAFDIELDADRDVLHLEPNEKPVRVLILASAKDSQVKAAQKMLTGLGYEVGEADGLFGRRTAKAAQAFQADHGMQPTGVLDQDTIQALYRASGAKRPSGHLYIRQGYKDVFDMPVDIRDPEERLGTHLYTAMSFEPTEKRGETVGVPWTVVTVDGAGGADAADPVSALDRVSIPSEARAWIETMLQPGSTVIISDAGYGWETGKGTDFIVQPQ